MSVDIGATTKLPSIDLTHKNHTHDETILLTAKSGDELSRQTDAAVRLEQSIHPSTH
jgi:hypothetical protein